MKRLQHKVAIVTGAAGGMGAAIAKLFADEGASVMATDIQEEKLSSWVTTAKNGGLLIDYAVLDVCDAGSWQQVTDKTMNVFGKIDILINNAGIYPGFVDCAETSLELWDQVLAVNLTGPYLGCKTCIPYFRKNGSGNIVNIASIAGLVGGNGAAYSASKGGLLLLTKDIAVTFAKDNIRANAICPGAILTPMTEDLIKQPGMMDNIRQMSPQGRIADPIEIANGALYLASDESLFMTGASITIDGGAVAK